jgi:hypothetical protein
MFLGRFIYPVGVATVAFTHVCCWFLFSFVYAESSFSYIIATTTTIPYLFSLTTLSPAFLHSLPTLCVYAASFVVVALLGYEMMGRRGERRRRKEGGRGRSGSREVEGESKRPGRRK